MARIESFHGLGCLVTGASAGIGRDIARQLADAGARVAITARRVDRLEELASELRERGAREAHVIVADLGEAGGVAHVIEQAQAALGEVDVLVNNAGFGQAGPFIALREARLSAMIEVNVHAALRLARGLVPGMVRRKRGGMLTVASVAAFQCAPFQSAYAGTKAMLLNVSEGLHQELKGGPVAITALCPGVTDTEFFEVAGYDGESGFLRWRMSSEKVARAGLRGLRRGSMTVVPGFTNKALIFVQRFAPRRLSAAIARRLMAGRRPKGR